MGDIIGTLCRTVGIHHWDTWVVLEPLTTQLGWLMVQLLDADRLRIQAIPMQPSAPTAFGTGAELYLR